MKIIGIDPGYERLGIAIVERAEGRIAANSKRETVVYAECFRTSPSEEIHERLHQAGNEVVRILDEYKPSVMALETLFITKNQKTAMRVAEVRGILIFEAKKRGLKICEYSPMEIKTAITGHGGSDKAAMIKMLKMLVKIPNGAALDDEFDAIAAALTCSARLKQYPQPQ